MSEIGVGCSRTKRWAGELPKRYLGQALFHLVWQGRKIVNTYAKLKRRNPISFKSGPEQFFEQSFRAADFRTGRCARDWCEEALLNPAAVNPYMVSVLGSLLADSIRNLCLGIKHTISAFTPGAEDGAVRGLRDRELLGTRAAGNRGHENVPPPPPLLPSCRFPYASNSKKFEFI